MAQFADIVSVAARNEARPGEVISAVAGVRNLYSSVISINVVGVPEYPGLPAGVYIDGLYPRQNILNVQPGELAFFTGSFTMPDSDVTVHMYAYYYGTDNLWHLDDEMTKVVRKVLVEPSTLSNLTVTYSKL